MTFEIYAFIYRKFVGHWLDYAIVEAPDEEKPSKNHFGWPPVKHKFLLYSHLVWSLSSMKASVSIFLGLAKVLLF